MKKPVLVTVLLTASVMLNLFFIAGYFYNRHETGQLARSPQQRVQALAQRIGLSEGQLEDLNTERRQLLKQTRQLREAQRREVQRLWRLLADGTTTPEQRDEVLGALARNELNYRVGVFDGLRKYLASLSPQQQERLLKAMRRRNLFRVTGVGRMPAHGRTLNQPRP